MGARLSEAGIAHAIIESDELDRVFPRPDPVQLDALSPGVRDVSQINLAALWATYRALGHSRLIMSGVMLHVAHDMRWIAAAIPNASITVIRLRASEPTLIQRLDQREIGSGRDAQVQRTLRQAKRLADEAAEGLLVIETDGRAPTELARTVLDKLGWARSG
jgi:hypothetical protein